MINRILLDPVAPAGGGGTPAPAKPATAPAAAPSPSPAPAAVAPAAAPEPASDDPFAPPPKPAGAAPAAAPAKPAAPVVPDDIDKLAPKELRERYKATKAERDALTKAKTDLEAKIKQFESQGKDTTALTGRLAALEKERDAAYAELRAAKQEASPEFKEKYDKPFNTAAERARKQVLELQVANAEDGTNRPATWEDFSALYSLPVGKAIEQANTLFGTSAQFVLGLRKSCWTWIPRARLPFRKNASSSNNAPRRKSPGALWNARRSNLHGLKPILGLPSPWRITRMTRKIPS